MHRIVVLISGRGSNLQALATSLDAPGASATIVAVLSDKRAAKGLAYAESRGIPTKVVPRRLKEQTLAEYNLGLAEVLAEFSPDLIVLAGFMRVLTKELISRFPGQIINIHPSLLPAFVGLDVHQRVLERGVCFSGCTVHFVTEEVDGGPIIAQAVVPVLQDDTEDSIAARVLKMEHQLLPRVVCGIADGSIRMCEDNGHSFATINSDRSALTSEDFLLSIAANKEGKS